MPSKIDRPAILHHRSILPEGVEGGGRGYVQIDIAHRGSPIDIEPSLGACRIGLAPDALPIPPSVDTQTDFELHGFSSCHRLFEACPSWEMNG